MPLRLKHSFFRLAGMVGLLLAVAWLEPPAAYADTLATATVEKLVFVRHAEKPARSLGQLTCQGLNRALALPPVLIGKYGRPDYIFAPDPKQDMDAADHSAYDYVRPLATIEPTAIQLGMPVNTQFNTDHTDALAQTLDAPKYHQALVFIAWEHKLIEHMVKSLVTQWGGDASVVPRWVGGDYDSIFVLEVTRTAGKTFVVFHQDHEGLDGQSTLCPAQQAKPQS